MHSQPCGRKAGQVFVGSALLVSLAFGLPLVAQAQVQMIKDVIPGPWVVIPWQMAALDSGLVVFDPEFTGNGLPGATSLGHLEEGDLAVPFDLGPTGAPIDDQVWTGTVNDSERGCNDFMTNDSVA